MNILAKKQKTEKVEKKVIDQQIKDRRKVNLPKSFKRMCALMPGGVAFKWNMIQAIQMEQDYVARRKVAKDHSE